MALFLRLMLMSVVALTVIYVCLLLFARARKREQLEEEWRAAGRPDPRKSFVDDALEAYSGPLRRRLFWGVYVVPLCAIAVLIYVTNFA